VDWKDDKSNGKRIHNFSKGDKYDGELIDGKPSGKGILHFENGDKYDG